LGKKRPAGFWEIAGRRIFGRRSYLDMEELIPPKVFGQASPFDPKDYRTPAQIAAGFKPGEVEEAEPEEAADDEPAAGNGQEEKKKEVLLELKLSRPLVCANKTLEVLNLDFDKLDGEGLRQAARRFRSTVKNEYVAVPWTDDRYQWICVAMLNGIVTDDLKRLGGKDAAKMMGACRDFFVDAEK
jgi:hypothetical protein